MTAASRSWLSVALACALIAACGDPPPGINDDGGDGPSGFLPPLRDGGLPPLADSGPLPVADAGPTNRDAGPSNDAGPQDQDAGTLDAGLADAGSPDAGVPILVVSAEGGPCFEAAGAFCDDGLVCAPYYVSGAGTCARACVTEGQACAGGGACVDYGTATEPFLVCATEVAEGGGCDPERLLVCEGAGVCLSNDDDPLGGTCRTTCSCQPGNATCSAAACGASTCVAINLSTGSGYCGAPAQPGEPCDPVASAVFCEGNATCLIDVFGAGTCRLRCDTPGVTTECTPTSDFACFGPAGDGFCLPTNNLGQGEVCTDGTTTPAVPLSCATGFGCIHLEDHAVGYGVCLEDCAGVGDAACETGSCFDIETVVPGGGARCLSELPSGARGCDPIAILCEEGSLCVNLGDDDSICKERCTIADCPGGLCECSGPDVCVTSFLSSTETGVCGTLAQRNAPCDEDDDVYCAPAPGEETAGNAIALCLVERCQYLCRYTSATTGNPVELACPTGMECRPDPTGRLLDTVGVCVDEP